MSLNRADVAFSAGRELGTADDGGESMPRWRGGLSGPHYGASEKGC